MTSPQFEHDLKDSIRTIPDYPKPGILFRDITTLLGNARAFRRAVDELVQPWAGMKIDKVAGIEARGFILGGAVAHQVSAGFVPIRKKGKLPHKRVSIAYSLAYGLDEMEMHEDAVAKNAARSGVGTVGTARRSFRLAFRPMARGRAVDRHPRFPRPRPLRPVRAVPAGLGHARRRSSPAPPRAHRSADACRKYWKTPRAGCRCTFPSPPRSRAEARRGPRS